MSEINLEQGTPEWHLHRAKYRNASEAGAVMGVDPYMTAYQLWQRRNGLAAPFEGNIATEHGNRNEPLALAKVSKILGVELAPKVFVNGEYSASFDGWGIDDNGDSYHVEIKSPFQKAKSARWAAAQTDHLPPMIEADYWQMVHQFYVMPAVHRFLFIDIVTDCALVPFHAQQGDVQRLLDAWDHFEQNPPEAPTIDLSADDILCDSAQDLKEIRAEIKALQEKEKATKDYLIARAIEEGKSIVVDGITVSQVTRKGNVNYGKIPQLKGVDLEDYRAKSTVYWKVS